MELNARQFSYSLSCNIAYIYLSDSKIKAPFFATTFYCYWREVQDVEKRAMSSRYCRALSEPGVRSSHQSSPQFLLLPDPVKNSVLFVSCVFSSARYHWSLGTPPTACCIRAEEEWTIDTELSLISDGAENVHKICGDGQMYLVYVVHIQINFVACVCESVKLGECSAHGACS